MAAFTSRRKRGNLGEDIACQFLESRGFTIVERNYLRPWGELDIVATKEEVYHIVEVKTISREKGTGGSHKLTAEDQMHPAKLRKLARTADLYMVHVKSSADYQIDLVAVELDYDTRRAKCRMYEQIL